MGFVYEIEFTSSINTSTGLPYEGPAVPESMIPFLYNHDYMDGWDSEFTIFILGDIYDLPGNEYGITASVDEFYEYIPSYDDILKKNSKRSEKYDLDDDDGDYASYNYWNRETHEALLSAFKFFAENDYSITFSDRP